MLCKRITTAAVLLLASAAPAHSQGTAPAGTPPASEDDVTRNLEVNAAKDAALFDFSYADPSSPVLPLIGVAADQITRVESIRKFGIAVLQGSEAAGTGPAVAIDFSPYWLMSTGAVSLQDYRDFTSIQRIFARTKAAAAASEGDGSKGTPSSLVFSLSSKLLSSQDPLLVERGSDQSAFERCIVGTSDARGELWKLADRVEQAGLDRVGLNPETAPEEFDQGRASSKALELKPAMAAAYEKCVKQVAKIMAGRSSLDFGAGIRFNGRAGKFSDLSESGAIVWLTYGTGVFGGTKTDDPFRRSLGGFKAQGVVHARYTFGEQFYDAAGAKTGKADAALLVAGLEGVPDPDGPDRFRWSLQAGWNMQEAATPADTEKDFWRFLGIARLRLTEGLWFNGTVGRVQGKGVKSDTYLTFGISFGPSGGTSGIDSFYARNRF